MPAGIGYHENSRLKKRAHKTLDEVVGSMKAKTKKSKKKSQKKGLKKKGLRSKRNKAIQDLMDKVK